MPDAGDSSSDKHVPTHLGVCSWSLQSLGPRDLLAGLETVGIDNVQLALVPLVEEPRIWADAAQILHENGVRVLSGMFATSQEDYTTLESIRETGGVRPDRTWPESLELAIRVADLAEEVQIRLITLHAGFIPHEPEDPVRETVLHRLQQLVDVFAERGVSIALETGQETATTLLSALEALERPSVGVNFDPANMILYGMGDPVEAIRMLAERVVQVHIKDALPAETPGSWGSEVPLGSGAVPWPEFLEAVVALPRSVDLVIERESGDERDEDIITARRLLETHFVGLVDCSGERG